MKTVRIRKGGVSKKILREVAAALHDGLVVAFPTETSYGLAADPENAAAVKKIFAIKGREEGKPLPLIAADLASASAYVRLAGAALGLAERYWPGPLTIVAPLKKGRSLAWHKASGGAPRLAGASAPRLVGASAAAAVRVPASAWARAIAREFGRPITSTSANLAGRPAAYSGAAVRNAFAGRRDAPDLVLDAGKLPVRPASTIVRLRRGKIEVLRQGPVHL
jgi:L-threonylcarbamoyladenylate synthase